MIVFKLVDHNLRCTSSHFDIAMFLEGEAWTLFDDTIRYRTPQIEPLRRQWLATATKRVNPNKTACCDEKASCICSDSALIALACGKPRRINTPLDGQDVTPDGTE